MGACFKRETGLEFNEEWKDKELTHYETPEGLEETSTRSKSCNPKDSLTLHKKVEMKQKEGVDLPSRNGQLNIKPSNTFEERDIDGNKIAWYDVLLTGNKYKTDHAPSVKKYEEPIVKEGFWALSGTRRRINLQAVGLISKNPTEEVQEILEEKQSDGRTLYYRIRNVTLPDGRSCEVQDQVEDEEIDPTSSLPTYKAFENDDDVIDLYRNLPEDKRDENVNAYRVKIIKNSDDTKQKIMSVVTLGKKNLEPFKGQKQSGRELVKVQTVSEHTQPAYSEEELFLPAAGFWTNSGEEKFPRKRRIIIQGDSPGDIQEGIEEKQSKDGPVYYYRRRKVKFPDGQSTLLEEDVSQSELDPISKLPVYNNDNNEFLRLFDMLPDDDKTLGTKAKYKIKIKRDDEGKEEKFLEVKPREDLITELNEEKSDELINQPENFKEINESNVANQLPGQDEIGTQEELIPPKDFWNNKRCPNSYLGVIYIYGGESDEPQKVKKERKPDGKLVYYRIKVTSYNGIRKEVYEEVPEEEIDPVTKLPIYKLYTTAHLPQNDEQNLQIEKEGRALDIPPNEERNFTPIEDVLTCENEPSLSKPIVLKSRAKPKPRREEDSPNGINHIEEIKEITPNKPEQTDGNLNIEETQLISADDTHDKPSQLEMDQEVIEEKDNSGKIIFYRIRKLKLEDGKEEDIHDQVPEEEIDRMTNLPNYKIYENDKDILALYTKLHKENEMLKTIKAIYRVSIIKNYKGNEERIMEAIPYKKPTSTIKIRKENMTFPNQIKDLEMEILEEKSEQTGKSNFYRIRRIILPDGKIEELQELVPEDEIDPKTNFPIYKEYTNDEDLLILYLNYQEENKRKKIPYTGKVIYRVNISRQENGLEERTIEAIPFDKQDVNLYEERKIESEQPVNENSIEDTVQGTKKVVTRKTTTTKKIIKTISNKEVKISQISNTEISTIQEILKEDPGRHHKEMSKFSLNSNDLDEGIDEDFSKLGNMF